MTDRDPYREAVHVILDMAAARDPDADHVTNAAAMNLAMSRLNDIGAVRATIDDDVLHLEMSDLLNATAVVVYYLARMAGIYSRTTSLDVIAQAREDIDGESP